MKATHASEDEAHISWTHGLFSLPGHPAIHLIQLLSYLVILGLSYVLCDNSSALGVLRVDSSFQASQDTVGDTGRKQGEDG